LKNGIQDRLNFQKKGLKELSNGAIVPGFEISQEKQKPATGKNSDRGQLSLF